MSNSASTSSTLPSGAFLTTIEGHQCTAVPRTDSSFLRDALGTATNVNSVFPTASAVTTSTSQSPPPAAATTTSSSTLTVVAATSTATTSIAAPSAAVSQLPPPSALAPQAQATPQSNPPPIQAVPAIVAPPSTSSVPSSTSSSLQQTTLSTSLGPPPSAPSSSRSSASSAAVSQSSATPSISSSSSSSSSSSTASSSSTDTVAAKTTSSTPSTPTSVQSELSPVATSTNDGISSGIAPITTTRSAAEAVSTTTVASSTTAVAAQFPSITVAPSGSKKDAAAPVVGGVLGGLAFIGLFGFLLIMYLRRRTRRRDSFLTPLDSDPGDMARSSTPEATGLDKLKNQFSSKVVDVGGTFSDFRAKATGQKKSVNMNRGNSQFLERIPQHSRNSSVRSTQSGHGVGERFGDWFERVKADLFSGLRREKEFVDPFTAAREKRASTVPLPLVLRSNTDFSQLLAMEERERQVAAEEQQAQQEGFGRMVNGGKILPQDPFADPPVAENPFTDPSNVVVSTPKPSQPSSSGYFAHVRRSSVQSAAPSIESLYPSSYAPDRDSFGYRDTYMSSATNGRKTKGRSDPFDLEKLRLDAAPPVPGPFVTEYFYTKAKKKPRVLSATNSELGDQGTYSSKYPSGTLSDYWGDPGPDLGPGSGSTSRENINNLHSEDSGTLGGGAGGTVGKAM